MRQRCRNTAYIVRSQVIPRQSSSAAIVDRAKERLHSSCLTSTMLPHPHKGFILVGPVLLAADHPHRAPHRSPPPKLAWPHQDGNEEATEKRMWMVSCVRELAAEASKSRLAGTIVLCARA
eukprot:1673478-Amphidinium_carterae.1